MTDAEGRPGRTGAALAVAIVASLSLAACSPVSDSDESTHEQWGKLMELAFNADVEDPVIRDAVDPKDELLTATAGEALAAAAGREANVPSRGEVGALDTAAAGDLVTDGVVDSTAVETLSSSSPTTTIAVDVVLEAVERGEVVVDTLSLARLVLMGSRPVGPIAKRRLDEAYVFHGALPERVVADPFTQILGMHAWAYSGYLPAELRQAAENLARDSEPMGPLDAYLYRRLGFGVDRSRVEVAAVEEVEDPAVAFGLIALASGVECRAVAVAPGSEDLHAWVEQPRIVPPGRLVLLALGARAVERCNGGSTALVSAIEGVVEGRTERAGQVDATPYEVWGALEARCVLHGTLQPELRVLAREAARQGRDRVLADPATAFGVGDVYAVERLTRLADGCSPGWWAGWPSVD